MTITGQGEPISLRRTIILFADGRRQNRKCRLAMVETPRWDVFGRAGAQPSRERKRGTDTSAARHERRRVRTLFLRASPAASIGRGGSRTAPAPRLSGGRDSGATGRKKAVSRKHKRKIVLDKSPVVCYKYGVSFDGFTEFTFSHPEKIAHGGSASQPRRQENSLPLSGCRGRVCLSRTTISRPYSSAGDPRHYV